MTEIPAAAREWARIEVHAGNLADCERENNPTSCNLACGVAADAALEAAWPHILAAVVSSSPATPAEDPYPCRVCRMACDDCCALEDNCCSGCGHFPTPSPATPEGGRCSEPGCELPSHAGLHDNLRGQRWPNFVTAPSTLPAETREGREALARQIEAARRRGFVDGLRDAADEAGAWGPSAGHIAQQLRARADRIAAASPAVSLPGEEKKP